MFERIQAIIADKLSIDEASVTMDALFIDDLNADSLDIVELIMALEDELDMEIPDEDVLLHAQHRGGRLSHGVVPTASRRGRGRRGAIHGHLQQMHTRGENGQVLR